MPINLTGGFLGFLCFIQHCSICRPSDSTVSEDAGIEPGLLRLRHQRLGTLTTRLDLIHYLAISHPLSARSHPLPTRLDDIHV
jgi:hypothetical protein